MSLAKAQNVSIPSATETVLVSYTASGGEKLMGFNAHGPVAAEVRLYINAAYEASQAITVSAPTAFYVDRLKDLANGDSVQVKVLHNDASNQDFSGTILGG